MTCVAEARFFREFELALRGSSVPDMTTDVTKQVIVEPGTDGGALRAPSGQGRSWALFSFAVPSLMALPLGWYGAGIGAEMSRTASLALWVSVCLVSWWISDCCARGLGSLLRRWNPPQPLLWIGGYWINMLLSSIYNPALLDALLRVGLVDPTPTLRSYFALDRNLLDPGYLWLLLLAGGPGFVVWMAGNFGYHRMWGRAATAPRAAAGAGAEPARSEVYAADVRPARAAQADTDRTPSAARPEVAQAAPVPLFFQRLERLTGLQVAELVAIEAEDHYVQVHSTRGKELVYVRFRDALEQLVGVPGLQIHRSAWVARQGVATLERQGRNLHVVLVTGERLRVSASNLGALREAAF